MSQNGKLRKVKLNRNTPLIGSQATEPNVEGSTKDPRSFEAGLRHCPHGVLVVYICCLCHPEQKEAQGL